MATTSGASLSKGATCFCSTTRQSRMCSSQNNVSSASSSAAPIFDVNSAWDRARPAARWMEAAEEAARLSCRATSTVSMDRSIGRPKCEISRAKRANCWRSWAGVMPAPHAINAPRSPAKTRVKGEPLARTAYVWVGAVRRFQEVFGRFFDCSFSDSRLPISDSRFQIEGGTLYVDL